MTTPLFLLRCKQLGLSMTELDLLTIGLINDMFTERENDDYDGWNEMASQADFDSFQIFDIFCANNFKPFKIIASL